MSALLSDGRKFLLKTDHPTYVDFAFSAIIAITLFPDEYGGRALQEEARIHLKDIWDPDYLKEIEAARNTVAGKYAMKIYKEYRFKKIK